MNSAKSTATRASSKSIPPVILANFVSENPNPVLIADNRGQVLWTNDAARNLVDGRAVTDLLPHDHDELVGVCHQGPGQWTFSEVEFNSRTFRFSYLCSKSTSLVHIYGRDVTEERRLERLNAKMADVRKTLVDTGVWLSQDLELKSVLQKTLMKAREMTDARYGALVTLRDGDIDSFLTSGLSVEETIALQQSQMPTKGIIGHMFTQHRPLRLADIASHPQSSGFPPGHPPMSSLLGAPIRYGDTLLGAVYLTEKNNHRFFTEADEHVIEMLAVQAAVAINNSRLYGEIQDFNRELEAKIHERTHALEQALTQAKAANETKSRFLASMSHELRTPLNAIIGFAEVLQDEYFGELNEKQGEYVADILESGQHLLSLINDILDLSKIEAGQMNIAPTTVELGDFLESTLVFIREKAAKHGIELLTDIAELPAILADERRIKQVVFNLLSNAAKFTPDGGSITLGCRMGTLGDVPEAARPAPPMLAESEDWVLVSVTDTGIGIPEEHQAKVFETFYQVEGELTGKTPGTGLGLSICRQIVELHGGAIWLTSQGHGNGCTFSFALPVTPPAGLTTSDLDEAV